MRIRLLAALALLLPAIPAAGWARPNPQPKNSGIVIHLFGPHSITSHILPSSPAAGPQAAAPQRAPVLHIAGPNGPPGPSAATDDAGPVSGLVPSPDERGPDAGGILREMFVTGDPDQKPGAALSTGRGNDQRDANAPNGKPAASGR